MKAEILVFAPLVHGGLPLLFEEEWSSHDSAYADGLHNLKRAGVDDLEPSLNARVEILTAWIWSDVSVVLVLGSILL